MQQWVQLDEVGCKVNYLLVSWLRTNLDKIISKFESQVHFPIVVSNGCCTIEIDSVFSSTYDWSRLGMQAVSEDPRQCDLLLVAGWINESTAEEIKNKYSEMVGRRSVMAIGACALSGSPYAKSNQKMILASDVVPVDVFVPGCPPRPEAIIEGLRLLKTRMKPGADHNTVLYSAIKENTFDL